MLDTLPFGHENVDTLPLDIMAVPSPPPSVAPCPSPSLTAQNLRASYQGRNLEDELASTEGKPGQNETIEQPKVSVPPPPHDEDCSDHTPSEEACAQHSLKSVDVYMGITFLLFKKGKLDKISVML